MTWRLRQTPAIGIGFAVIGKADRTCALQGCGVSPFGWRRPVLGQLLGRKRPQGGVAEGVCSAVDGLPNGFPLTTPSIRETNNGRINQRAHPGRWGVALEPIRQEAISHLK